METNLIHQLADTFEGHAQRTESGSEYWLAHDLQQLLGYAEWRNFRQTAISKAKTACEVTGHRTADHFVDVNKMVEIGSSERNLIFTGGVIGGTGNGEREGREKVEI
jgi:DNA-damage-inducible protein D